jgi:thioredoxin reductase (NADPH)
MPDAPFPVAIVGAGPTGIACAIELGRRDIEAICYDRGAILDSIYHFPEEMVWFSTRDLLDIAGVPFGTPDAHPTRLETLAYYRAVAEKFGVRVESDSEVLAATLQPDGSFVLELSGREPREIRASAVVVATGFFHNPKRLPVPGGDLPIVHERYVSGYPFHGRKVVVVGGKNSAAEAALDLYRHGASVTMVVRAGAISERVKYWIKPDLENRIKEGSITAFFSTTVQEIRRDALLLHTPDGPREIANQWVLAMTGYHPDFDLLQRFGVTFSDDAWRTPLYDETTFETRRPGIYIAGTVCGGYQTGRWFIENGRFHARQIAEHLAGEVVERIPFEQIHWKTQE